MANPEHLEILKQGVDFWNKWREETPGVQPDLSKTRIRRADIRDGHLRGINFCESNISDANIFLTDMCEAIIQNSNLGGTTLNNVYLRRADMSGTDLSLSNIFFTDLNRVNLTQSDLLGVSFVNVNLDEANLTMAKIGYSSFGNVDLSAVKGLDSVKHKGPSTIGIDTISTSKGNLSETFLRGCGVPENIIQHIPSLVDQHIQFYSCFISYSSKDQDFADRLYADLQYKGVRCWFAPEDLKIGDKIRDRINQSIRVHDKLLLILSENSIDSEWVEDEVEAAYEQEKKRNTTVLFPVRIDNSVMDTDMGWTSKLRRSRHVGDFTNWKDLDSYQKAFDRVLKDLKTERE